ncbi:hypothetical protein DLAC_08646 [Tieghemostelium lacteum]|uniref:Uncharacterized protein n=1 Tax=Tieghemostelium lacteum TaxID=361077 RepID=A0A151Z7W9_TIELA|nr:hypothetical protein DLAC_08646 [Tieghemostelium lacteum]|eukprot:KYQ90063.1 hypothetical protein DLAC_08646 [Tieghemostelium lacteum]
MEKSGTVGTGTLKQCTRPDKLLCIETEDGGLKPFCSSVHILQYFIKMAKRGRGSATSNANTTSTTTGGSITKSTAKCSPKKRLKTNN